MIETLIEIISYGFVGLCISGAIWVVNELSHNQSKGPKI